MKSISDVLRITIRHNGPMVTTDPNGFAVIGMIPSVMTTLLKPTALKSDLSGELGSVIYTDTDGSLTLTPDELMRLAGLRLTPEEYFAIRKKVGIHHQWHEDFYDPDTGVALQPRTPVGEAPLSDPEDSPLDTLKELMPKGTVIIGLDDPELLHNTIAEAVGEPPLRQQEKPVMTERQTELEFLQELEAEMFEALQHQEQMGFVPLTAVHREFVDNMLKTWVPKLRERLLDLETLSIRSRPDKIDRLVEAYIKMAKANHYLVRVVLSDYTPDDLDEAEQLLIIMDNEADNKDPDLNLALDILEQDRRAMR